MISWVSRAAADVRDLVPRKGQRSGVGPAAEHEGGFVMLRRDVE